MQTYFPKNGLAKRFALKQRAQYSPQEDQGREWDGNWDELIGDEYVNSGDYKYGDNDNGYSASFADSYIELCQAGKVIQTFPYPEQEDQVVPSRESDDQTEDSPDYMYYNGSYLEFVLEGRVVWTLTLHSMMETQQSTEDRAFFASELNKF